MMTTKLVLCINKVAHGLKRETSSNHQGTGLAFVDNLTSLLEEKQFPPNSKHQRILNQSEMLEGKE